MKNLAHQFEEFDDLEDYFEEDVIAVKKVELNRRENSRGKDRSISIKRIRKIKEASQFLKEE